MNLPFFQILMGDRDVTATVAQGNMSLTITDGVGVSADTISFDIDDERGIIAPPKTGVDLTVIGGYRDGPKRNFGRFTVDEVSLSGWPMKIQVSAMAIGAKTAAKEPRSGSFKKPKHTTYGDVLKEIAERNNWKLAAAPDIASQDLGYEAQSEEDDLAFLTRLGEKRGFSFTVKSGHLIVSPRGRGVSVGGIELPPILITKGVNVLSYNVSRRDRPKFKNVRATWFDRGEVETRETSRPSSTEGPDYLLRSPFRDEDEATEAARSAAEDLRRDAGSASFEIVGDPTARAEAFAIVSGVRSLIDGRWRATEVTHQFDGSGGYTTSVQCELTDAGDTV